MQELCFLTNVSGEQWAAWVSAIGTVGAIVGSAWISNRQLSKQHQNTLKEARLAQVAEEFRVAETLAEISRKATRAGKHLAQELGSRDAIYDFATGKKYVDIDVAEDIEQILRGVPLHTLPASMISWCMVLSAMVRQLKRDVAKALNEHRTMNAADFTSFILGLKLTEHVLGETTSDFEAHVDKLLRENDNLVRSLVVARKGHQPATP